MKQLGLYIIICLFLLPFSCFAADDGYGYPIPDPYAATILGTPATLMPKLPAGIHIRQLVLDVIPGREKPPIFFYDEGLRCSFVRQDKKAPLVFLIAGAGSSNQANKITTMMMAFYQAGFHVITLPSPTNSNFIISASRSSVPGDLAEDSEDLYRAMESAWNKVKEDIEVSDFNLCGYSMGGAQAAFVARLDEERRIFNFRKVLMINPAVNLYNSIMRFEELLKKIPGGSKKQGIFFNRMLARFTNHYRYGNFIGINDDFIYSIYEEQIFSTEDTAGLIGLTHRINLAGTIFSSDVMTGGGYVVPKNRVLKTTDSLFDYFLVSSHLGFADYFNEYFYPHFKNRRPGITREMLIASESLKSIDGYLRSSTKIGMMTNENDFILTADELAYLKELFGSRAKIYPRGGHLGNLEYTENLAYMVSFFGPDGGKP
jgi:pimeloyl-ACP methyl ester carboxylesterase